MRRKSRALEGGACSLSLELSPLGKAFLANSLAVESSAWLTWVEEERVDEERVDEEKVDEASFERSEFSHIKKNRLDHRVHPNCVHAKRGGIVIICFCSKFCPCTVVPFPCPCIALFLSSVGEKCSYLSEERVGSS